MWILSLSNLEEIQPKFNNNIGYRIRHEKYCPTNLYVSKILSICENVIKFDFRILP